MRKTARMIKVSTLTKVLMAALMLCILGAVPAAAGRHHCRFWAARAHWRAHSRFNALGGIQSPQPFAPLPVPDLTVQYGYVREPASGSLGAMLQGRNPAAGVLP